MPMERNANQEVFRRWLIGYPVDFIQLGEFLNAFPEAKVCQRMWKGLAFKHYPKESEVTEAVFSSWSINEDTARYFAGHEKYGFLLSGVNEGYSVEKILKILSDEGVILDSLKSYNSKREDEVIAPINPKNLKIKRVGLY